LQKDIEISGSNTQIGARPSLFRIVGVNRELFARDPMIIGGLSTTWDHA